MALELTIDESTFTELNEGLRSAYKKDGDMYRLDVKGVAPKEKVDEFRNENVSLREKLEAYADIDLEEVKALKAEHQKIKDKELIDKGDIDTLITQKIEIATQDFENKLKAKDDVIGQLTQQIHERDVKQLIEGEAQKAFSENRIRPEVQEDLMKAIKSTFTVKDGKALAMDGETILAGEKGNLTIQEYVESKPDYLKIPSDGGRGRGNIGGRGTESQNVSGVSRIAQGLAKGQLSA